MISRAGDVRYCETFSASAYYVCLAGVRGGIADRGIRDGRERRVGMGVWGLKLKN
jgi:hypothetical protein